jgi:hypothetical protein
MNEESNDLRINDPKLVLLDDIPVTIELAPQEYRHLKQDARRAASC